jgi:hypothetical protein
MKIADFLKVEALRHGWCSEKVWVAVFCLRLLIFLLVDGELNVNQYNSI